MDPPRRRAASRLICTIDSMDRRERERIMKEGGVHEGTTRTRAAADLLHEDLEGSPLKGKPLRRALRNFRPDVAGHVGALGGPLPYMQRLREIDRLTAQHERELADEWLALADAIRDPAELARAWRETAYRRNFDEVNDLIARHNRFFPIEARLPMDPRTGDFVRIAGRHYARRPLDAEWVLERLPVSRAA
jgi:hypothetical protein